MHSLRMIWVFVNIDIFTSILIFKMLISESYKININKIISTETEMRAGCSNTEVYSSYTFTLYSLWMTSKIQLFWNNFGYTYRIAIIRPPLFLIFRDVLINRVSGVQHFPSKTAKTQKPKNRKNSRKTHGSGFFRKNLGFFRTLIPTHFLDTFNFSFHFTVVYFTWSRRHFLAKRLQPSVV